MNLRHRTRAQAQAPETLVVLARRLAALLPLAAMVPVAGLLALSAPGALAQPITDCRREATNRDPLSGAEAWAIETCTTTDRVTGAFIKVQTCTTNRRYATTECVDQVLPKPAQKP
ncbi:hypothetical protein [Cyanobium sp. ATX 6F1]|nr:hypothetical protein [Cyanobium sp. ATX 6F1]MCP9915207.1 hypothetical protein [Cyanobium sp. ATX 6F1]